MFYVPRITTSSDEKEEELSNMNGWLTEDANDSDLESTTSNQPMSLTMEDTGAGADNRNGGGNIGFEHLQKEFVAWDLKTLYRTGCAVQLTRGLKRLNLVIDNGGCLANQKGEVCREFIHWQSFDLVEYSSLRKETKKQLMQRHGIDFKLDTPIDFHELAQSWSTFAAILTAVILTDEAVHIGTLAKAGEKRKERDEASKSESVGKDEKKAKGGQGFVAAVPPRRENGNFPNVGREKETPGAMSTELRGRACNMNDVDALQDPNVVTGTYSLNNLYIAVLFDFGADFKVANGKKEEVDKIFHGCKLELGDSIFPIDLIPLGQGSFDEIVGMDWLSNQKAVIVCHEKIVRIPVEEGKVIYVQGECNVGKTKTLMSTKANEPTLSNIPIVRDFKDVFPDNLSGLPPQ
ncbi:putative reverse transcriptase domain-containing protein [Tanacetum coccineum]